MNLRISTTLVESYRRYRANDDMTAEEFDVDVMGKFVPTRQTELGSAFDKILEHPERYQGDPVIADGIAFPVDVVREALAEIDLRGLPQVKVTREYLIGSDVVTVVAKMDRVHGRRVREYKTRWSTLDIDKYRDGCQWRFYLDITGADVCDYTVFVMSEYKDGEIALREVVKWSEYPYPDLHLDCRELLSGLVEYVHARGLERYCVARDSTPVTMAVPA